MQDIMRRERYQLLQVGKYSAHQHLWLGVEHRLHAPLSHEPLGSAHKKRVCCSPADPTSKKPVATRNQITVRPPKNISVCGGSKQSTSASHGTCGHERVVRVNVDNTHRNIERV